MLNYIPRLWNLIDDQELWLYQEWEMAKSILLANWKCGIIPNVKDWLSEMCDLSVWKRQYFLLTKECNNMCLLWQRVCDIL